MIPNNFSSSLLSPNTRIHRCALFLPSLTLSLSFVLSFTYIHIYIDWERKAHAHTTKRKIDVNLLKHLGINKKSCNSKRFRQPKRKKNQKWHSCTQFAFWVGGFELGVHRVFKYIKHNLVWHKNTLMRLNLVTSLFYYNVPASFCIGCLFPSATDSFYEVCL